MITKIHKNLHAEKAGEPYWAITQKGLVVGYADTAVIRNAEVKYDRKKAAFSQSGNKRTVHCWVAGDLVFLEGFVSKDNRQPCTEGDHNTWSNWSEYDHRQISYNPARDKTMQIDCAGEKIEYRESPYAVFGGNSKAWAILG